MQAMQAAQVLVERVESYDRVEEFISKVFKFFRHVLPKQEVFVKPNFLKFDDPGKGCITHPAVVKAVVNCISDFAECTIVEGGFRRKSADKCFEVFKLREMARCVNLNRDEFVKVNVGGSALKEVRVAKTALKVAGQGFISLPKMKVHHLTKVTLGMKNNMGFLKKPAVYMHLNIHRKLVDLLRVFDPGIVIIDGIIGGEGSESRTRPVEHGVMVASNDVVAADVVASGLMGFNWREVEHLKLAVEYRKKSDENWGVEVVGDAEGLVREYRLSLVSRLLGGVGV